MTLTLNDIDIFTINDDKFKIRLIIGYKIKNTNLYYYKKFGAIIDNTLKKNSHKLIDIASRTFDSIPKNGNLEFDIYGYHLGESYDTDNQGEIIGNWPIISKLKLHYDNIFIMPSGNLPEKYKNLKILRILFNYHLIFFLILILNCQIVNSI